MNCKEGYPCQCTDNCQLHRSGQCRVRLNNSHGNNRRDNNSGNNNGGSNRHGNAPRSDNRGRNQKPPKVDDYIPMPCEQMWQCMGVRCSLFQSGQGCRRADLRAQKMPKNSSAEETIGGIILTGLETKIKAGLKNLFGL